MKKYAFLLVAALFVLALNSAVAQVVPIPVSATVTATPLAITAGELALDALQVNQTYSVVPDGAGSALLEPVLNAEAVSTYTETEIAGDGNARVLVTMSCPSRLYDISTPAQGWVEVSYNGSSAAWGPTGATTNYFNPTNPVVVDLDPAGAVFIGHGGIFHVPSNAGPGTFTGNIMMTAVYTGF